ncbi:LysR family transcriptional regulator [Actinokineospora globicatena]|uniref:LysR family transcriptional regulator n=1 Tax=Actinokineospora globicatena TaxID=103729 RepID=UPI0020A4416C|nr:LysR family transcriptional regulator [Actinokineospora globicatena]MCP2303113.1 DNA-binding transcriptional regulator, LysR family [Actinokineospora globicatena]GLW79773.1 small neutral protease regulatory protein [Actinokineospora globicatena]GLW85817.1 small neutral protease regulatory protein [Actinokineospora globicatena]
MDLEIRHLRAVCTIAEAGSLSQGATRLGISQPSLSTLLQRVERTVGGRLFERSRTGVVPTELGTDLVRRARVVLAELDAFGAGTSADAGGPIRFGTVHMECVATLFERVERSLPGAEVSMQIEPSSTALARSLTLGHLDVAVLGMAEDHDIPLPRDIGQRIIVPWVPVYVALSAEHPLASAAAVPLAGLADEAWISPPGADDGSLAALRAACRQAGFTPDVRFEVPSGGGRRLIAAGRAVQLVEPTSQGGPGIAVRPLAGEPMRIRLLLAWRRQRIGWEQANRVYAEVVAAYSEQAMASTVFRPWWEDHREARPPA